MGFWEQYGDPGGSRPQRPRWMLPTTLGGRVRIVGRNPSPLADEASTREFLARVVYRVPVEWVDEVVRLRMAELDG